MKKAVGIAAALVLGVTLTGCSSVSTQPDEVALHYSGGSFSSKNFDECVPVSTKQVDGPGDKHYTYPSSQRNVVFDDSGGDINTITFVTKDGIEMRATGVLNFLLNTSCKPFKVGSKEYKGGALQQFHELIGNRYKAYNDGDKTSSGWNNQVVPIYLGRPLDTAIDRAGQNFTYTDLYYNPKVKSEWEKSVLAQLPALVDRQTDGDTSFFENYSITLQKPEPPQAIKDSLIERQKAIAEADSAKAKAEAQEAAAHAQEVLAEAQAKTRQAEIKGFNGDIKAYLCKLTIDAGMSCFPPGSNGIILNNQTK